MSEESLRLDAIILAGATVGEDDPLLQGTGVARKALLPILGKPMVVYVEEALRASGCVDRIVCVGLGPEDEVSFSGAVVRLAAQGDIVANTLAGLDWLRATGSISPYVLIASSDIPLLTGPVVARFADTCVKRGGDLFYSVVEKSILEAAFPGSGRSYAHLRDGYWDGGDLFMVRSDLSMQKVQMMRDLIAQRKDALKMARVLGPRFLLAIVLRRLTLADAERRVSQILGIEGRVVASPDWELAMDVDKPHQLEMVIRYMETHRA